MSAPLAPQLRRQYLAHLKRAIETGTYETPDKLAAALEMFLDHSDAVRDPDPSGTTVSASARN